MKKILNYSIFLFLLSISFTSSASDCAYFQLRGPQSDCDGLSGKNYTAFSSYSISVTWTPINGTLVSVSTPSTLESRAIIDWTPGLSHMLICLDISGCADTLYVQSCCNGIAEIRDLSTKTDLNEIKSVLGASISGSGSNAVLQVPSQVINVEAQFEIRDINAEFTGCTFIMGRGSVIYTPGLGNYTIFNQCTFASSSCEEMWQGIFCQVEGNLVLDDCEIRDAEYAIKIFGKISLIADKTVFDRNYIDIFVPPLLGSTDFGPGSRIKECTFEGGNTLKQYYYGQMPLPQNHRSHIAIFVNNLVGTFPSYSTLPVLSNTIQNFPNGIYAINSVIDGVYNFNFNNIQYSPDYPSRYSGTAILANSSINSRLVVGKNNTSSNRFKNQFTNCSFGIINIGKSNPTIKYNSFIHNNRNFQNLISIYIMNSSTSTVLGQMEIQNNTFDELNYYNPISPFPSTPNPSVNGFFSTAISISNGTPLRQNIDVSWNVMNNMRIGVYMNNNVGDNTDPDALSIHDNFINSTIPHADIVNLGYFHYGIWANAASWMSIGANDIYRNTNLAGASANFENLMLGLNLKQIQNCQVGYNHITDYGTGFRVLGNCNGSYFHCNQMRECVQGFRLANASMTDQGSNSLPSDNKWELFPTPNSTTYKRIDGSVTQRVNWYHKDDYNTPTFSNDYGPSPASPNVIQDFPFITGSSCYQNAGDNSMVIKNLHEIISGNLTYIGKPIENEIMEKEYAYKLLARDSALKNLDPLFKDFYDEYSVLNEGQFFQAENLISQDELDLALAQLNLVSNPEIIEQYKIYTTQLAIAELKDTDDNWDESPNQTLNEIAYTDAWLGGSGVFNARHLLFTEVDDRENNLRIGRPTEEIKPNNISVYPNPANESLTIFNVTTNDQFYSVELIDLTGRIVYSKLLSNNIIRTDNIQNGSYILRILQNGNPIQMVKVEIVHN